MSVSADIFRRLALELPEAVEQSHFGHPDFRVRGKIFATLITETRAGLKCDATSLSVLVRTDPATYRDEWRGRWLGVDLTRINKGTAGALLADAWCLTAPKRVAAEFKRRQAP